MNYTNIKAIETSYNGYRFRSRLEARWAVFFDAIGLDWEYENEGYVLSDSTKYLHDFYFPKGWGRFRFAEVKPRCDHSNDFSLSKYKRFCADGYSCILLDGPPDVTQYYAWENNSDSGIPNWEMMDYAFCAGEGSYMGHDANDSEWFVCSGMTRDNLKELTHGNSREWFGDMMFEAVEKARGARFERF